MTRLLTLNGRAPKIGQPKFSLISFSGKDPRGMLATNPLDLSDIDAGIWTLSMLLEKYPNLKWGDLITGNLSGFFDWVGNKASDIGDKLGEWTGDAIRLVTDKKVKDGVASYATAYATGGSSLGLEGLVNNIGGGSSQLDTLKSQFNNLLQSIGINTKADIQQAGVQGSFGISPMWWVGGLSVGLLLVLLTRGRR